MVYDSVAQGLGLSVLCILSRVRAVTCRSMQTEGLATKDSKSASFSHHFPPGTSNF